MRKMSKYALPTAFFVSVSVSVGTYVYVSVRDVEKKAGDISSGVGRWWNAIVVAPQDASLYYAREGMPQNIWDRS